MKLKYYLRGLGMGIVVTTLILSVALHNKGQMTDAEVIERAEELGMVQAYESGVLDEQEQSGKSTEKQEEQQPHTSEEKQEVKQSDTSKEKQEVDQSEPGEEKQEEQSGMGAKEQDKQSDTSAEKQEEGSATGAEQKKSDDADKTDLEAEETEGEKEDTNISAQTVVITINGGDGSDMVAKKLQDAGIVADARTFDRFLCENGYDKRLCTGEHRIPMNADDATIAKLLTSKQ